MSFFEELKRRNVFRVGIAYLIGSWLLAQIAELLLDTFKAPEWTMQFIVVVLMIGFPLALFFAWAFEMTPDGVKREAKVDRATSISAETGRKLDRAIIIVLVAALAYFIWESRLAEKGPEPFSEISVSQSGQAADQKRALTPIATAAENSVAVLPFLNMSSDPEQEYFSDGITEEIINALVKIPGLSVPARTSVFAFKGEARDVRSIGRELNVAHVLEGSIRSQNNQVRITAQLIKVDDGFHLWSETFDRELSNIFKVQEEIAASISKILVGELGLAQAAVTDRTSNMRAYDLYLQGRALLRARGEANLMRAIELFEQVIALDPEFTPAWAARAIAYQVSTTDEKLALEVSRQALDRDPDNVDALTALAAGLRNTWQWAEAEQAFEKALAIDPQSAELLEDYAEFLASVGRLKEYLKISERGYNIDPYLIPLTVGYMWALKADGQHQKALEVFEKNFKGTHEWYERPIVVLGSALATANKSLAIEQVRLIRAEKLGEDVRVAAITLLETPEDTEARDLLRVAVANENQNFIGVWIWIAKIILISAGDLDFVLESDLSNFTKDGESDLEEIWQPEYAAVRRHPRWGEVLNVVNLPEYWDSTSWPDLCQRTNDGRITCQ